MSTSPAPQEIELKLTLAGIDADEALRRLRRLPGLARRKFQEQWLINRYFDTPDMQLQAQRCALRLRWVGTSAQAQPGPSDPWIQTFKTAGLAQGGLSQRGEWETPVEGDALSRDALRGTDWDAIDPDDSWFATLQPCFETRCRRVTWQIRQRDGTTLEIALDVGTVQAGATSEPLIEVEIELLAGAPSALIDMAKVVAAHLPCLPLNMSKAERGYALAAGRLHQPVKARALEVDRSCSISAVAVQAMTEMLDQYTRNLAGILHRDEPELVHQARVGWRRWRSMERLIRPWIALELDYSPLRPLLDALGQQRDVDVACNVTLPQWQAYWDGDPQAWEQALTALQRWQTEQRDVVRKMIATPATGLALLAMTRSLWHLSQAGVVVRKRWARVRLERWHRKMDQLLQSSACCSRNGTELHEARLLAKRLRYGSEALSAVMSAKTLRLTQAWANAATTWQERIGQARDARQAAYCLERVGASAAMVAYFQGISAALERCAQVEPSPRR